MHDAMNIVPNAVSRADTQAIETLQLTIGGRIGHWIPIPGRLGLLRNE